MAIDHKPNSDRDAASRFDARAIAEGQTERLPPAAKSLNVESAPPKPGSETHGFDPYNTTGGFDRKKNWTQVRKR